MTPLSFRAWKEQEILEAQNQVLRVASRLAVLKSNKASSGGSASSPLANGKLKKLSDTDTLSSAEQDLRRAKESLEDAKNLKFEDYVDVYVPTLHNQPEAQQKLAEKMSKEELAELAKGLMRNAKHHEPLGDGVTLSSRSKAP